MYYNYSYFKIMEAVGGDMDFKSVIQREIEIEKEFLKQYQNGLKTVTQYEPYRLSEKRQNRYYVVHRDSKREKSLSKDKFHIVRYLRKYKLCREGISRIEKNLNLLVRLEKIFLPYDPASVEAALPKAYRTKPEEPKDQKDTEEGRTHRVTQSENPYHPENLKHITSFGLVVRSRVEAAAAELAYSRGYYIMYEKRILLYDEEGNMHVVYPDFILCENEQSPDVTWIYWEHLGLLDMEDYRERTMLKLKLFPQNGILPGRNLILTTDGVDQSIDLMAIRNVLDSIKNLEVLT